MNVLKTILIYLCATAVAFLVVGLGFTEVNVVVIYILFVLLTSFVTQGYFYGISAAVLCTLSFNFFFSDPVYSFNVYDTAYIFTFVVMLASAVLTSTLTSRLLRAMKLAGDREKQAKTLYQITAKLSQEDDIVQILSVGISELESQMDQTIICFMQDKNESCCYRIDRTGTQIISEADIPSESKRPVFREFQIQNELFLWFYLSDMIAEDLPLSFFDSILIQVKTALEREVSNRQREAARLQVKQEQLKSSLLRAISHDLRTPLTAISGSAEILLQRLTSEYDIEVVESIHADSRWLTQLIENILNLTRLQEDRLDANIVPEPVEEVIAGAVAHITKYVPECNISVDIPEGLIVVPMDSRIIQQVLINLLDNAVKYTPEGDRIVLSVTEEQYKVWFSVKDEGSGIEEEHLPKLFDLFFTTKSSHSDSRRGVGLGLSICKAIIEYHGGQIYAANRLPKGAEFRFYLNKEIIS